MFGKFSYLFSILFFAGPVIVFTWIFGFHILKKYVRTILFTPLIMLFFALPEVVALQWKAWDYNSQSIFNMQILGTQLETYIFAIFISAAAASVVIVWSFNEDRKKSIIPQTIKDVVKGTYAIWKKN